MSPYTNEKQSIVEAGLWLSEKGYFGSNRGSGGNISVRLSDSAMAVTPTSVPYQELTCDDICVVGLDNSIEVKAGRKPSIETPMHSVIYRQRPDVNAVVHTHQIYGSVFAIMNMPIPALFDEVSLAIGPVVDVIPYAFSGSAELAANTGALLTNNANAYIIQNHGIVALGCDLDRAILHAELLEKVAHIYCLALSTGKTITTLPASTIDFAAGLRNSQVQKAAK